MLETMQYVRKTFNIDAVRVTAENIQEVAKWVDSEVRSDDMGQYVKVRVHRPLNDDQTKAYIGRWVLYAGTGYKVYTDKAFSNNFVQVSSKIKLVDTSAPRSKTNNSKHSQVEIINVIEGDVVVPKRVPKKKVG